MKIVYAECFRVLKTGRHYCVVIRDVTKERVTYPLHCNTISLMDQIGFNLEEMKYVLLLSHAHYDYVLIFRKGDPIGQWKMVDKYDEPFWDMRRMRDTMGDHPAAFITAIPRVLIGKLSKPGEMVLDPFGGTGSTAVACKSLNRDYIYMELNPEYSVIATDRLAKAKPGLNSFMGRD